MENNYLANPLIFLVDVFFGAYCLLVLLRFVLQWVRVDFYNPISQFVVRLTAPPLQPLRRVIPSLGGQDWASLLLVWLLQTLKLWLIAALGGLSLSLALAPLLAIPELASLLIDIFLWSIILQAILSWVNPDPYHPVYRLLHQITEPVLRPVRRLLPPIEGFDLSPFFGAIILVLLKMLLLPPLTALVLGRF